MIDDLVGNDFDMQGLAELKNCWEVCKMTKNRTFQQ